MPKVLKYPSGMPAKPKEKPDVVKIPDETPKDNYETLNASGSGDGFVEAVTPEMKAAAESKKIVREAENEAKKIIENAKQQAEQIKSEGNKNAAAAAAAAREDGYNAAFTELRDRINTLLSDTDDILTDITQSNSAFIKAYSENVGLLAIDIASEIMNQKIDADLLSMCDMVEKAMSTMRNASWAVIKISKDMVPLLELLQSEISEKCSFIPRITVVGDDIPKDNCIIESSIGIVDISIPQQLYNLQERINQILREETTG